MLALDNRPLRLARLGIEDVTETACLVCCTTSAMLPPDLPGAVSRNRDLRPSAANPTVQLRSLTLLSLSFERSVSRALVQQHCPLRPAISVHPQSCQSCSPNMIESESSNVIGIIQLKCETKGVSAIDKIRRAKRLGKEAIVTSSRRMGCPKWPVKYRIGESGSCTCVNPHALTANDLSVLDHLKCLSTASWLLYMSLKRYS